MSCDCINTLNRKFFESGSNTSIKVDKWFDRNTGATEFRVLILLKKVHPNNRKTSFSVKPNFCPFCGNKYESPKLQETTQEAQ